MKKSLIFIAAVAAMACACSKSEVVMEQSPAKGICFKTSVSAVKGAVLDGNSLGDKYAIYAAATQRDKAGAITVDSYFDETKFAKTAASGNNYVPAAPIYWPVGDCTMDFLAFAIDSTKHGDVTATWPMPVSANGVRFNAWDTYNNQADLLYAYNNEVSPTAAAVHLEFKHAQAAIAFTACTNDLSEQVFLDSIIVSGLQTKGDFVIDNSKVKFVAGWENLAAGDSVVKNVSTSGVGKQIEATPKAVGDTLLIPQQSKKLIRIVYHLDGSTEKVSREFENDLRGAWEMGKKYIYKFELSFKEIKFTEEVLSYEPVSTTTTI